MTLVLKRRCKNMLERRARRRHFNRRCEINFLPHVFYAEDESSVTTSLEEQRLRCRSNEVPGFSSCPERPPANDTVQYFCDPLRENSKRCETGNYLIHSSCRLFEICDHAVLLTGGWNPSTITSTYRRNTLAMYRLFRDNGFKRKNIKVFYANGMRDGIQGKYYTQHSVNELSSFHDG